MPGIPRPLSVIRLPPDAAGQVARVAKRFALIGAAGEMATTAGITGWPDGTAFEAAHRCFQDWLEARVNGAKARGA